MVTPNVPYFVRKVCILLRRVVIQKMNPVVLVHVKDMDTYQVIFAFKNVLQHKNMHMNGMQPLIKVNVLLIVKITNFIKLKQ